MISCSSGRWAPNSHFPCGCGKVLLFVWGLAPWRPCWEWTAILPKPFLTEIHLQSQCFSPSAFSPSPWPVFAPNLYPFLSVCATWSATSTDLYLCWLPNWWHWRSYRMGWWGSRSYLPWGSCSCWERYWCYWCSSRPIRRFATIFTPLTLIPLPLASISNECLTITTPAYPHRWSLTNSCAIEHHWMRLKSWPLVSPRSPMRYWCLSWFWGGRCARWRTPVLKNFTNCWVRTNDLGRLVCFWWLRGLLFRCLWPVPSGFFLRGLLLSPAVISVTCESQTYRWYLIL